MANTYPYQFFADTADMAGLYERELAAELGYNSKGGFLYWRKTGRIPKAVYLACCHLRPRLKKERVNLDIEKRR